jgi:hypothetical protein
VSQPQSEPPKVEKLGYWQPVRVENGVPICSHCGDPMVPGPEPDTWQCWLSKAVFDLLADKTPTFIFLDEP